MVIKLPVWNEWTVDEHLQEFRKAEFIDGQPKITFIDFNSDEGKRMLYEYRKDINLQRSI